MLRNLASSVIIYGISSSLSKFFSVFLVPLFARTFTPEEYGVMDLVTTVISVAGLLGMLQLESAVGRFYFESKKRGEEVVCVATAFWSVVALSVAVLIVIVLCAKTLSSLLFGTDSYEVLFRVAAVNVVLVNVFGLLSVLMRFLKRAVIYSAIVLAQVITTTAVTVWLVGCARRGLIGAFVGQVAGLVVGSGLLLFYLRHHIGFGFRRSLLKEFLRYSLPQVPAVAGNWLNAYANRFIILGYLSLADIGIYAVALKIASIFRVLEHAFRMAWGPFFWEEFERTNHREMLRRCATGLSMGVFALVILFCCGVRPLMPFVATKEYAYAGTLMPILALAFAFPILTQVVGVGPDIAKRTSFNSLIAFTGLGVNIVLLLVLVPLLGLLGVPLCLLLSNVLTMVCSWHISERLYPVGFPKRQFLVDGFLTVVAMCVLISETPFWLKLPIIGAVLAAAAVRMVLWWSQAGRVESVEAAGWTRPCSTA